MSSSPAPSDRHDEVAASMLRDEALDVLASKIEDDLRAKLEITVDHGKFSAHYIYRPQGDGDAGVSVISGERLPNLTNALVSLVERLS